MTKKYRSWEIERRWISTIKIGGRSHQYDWQAVHEDYDGPEDGRIVFAGTLPAILDEINEREDY